MVFVGEEVLLAVDLPVAPDDVALSYGAGVLVEEVEHGEVLVDRAREHHGLVLLVELEGLALVFEDETLGGELMVAEVGGGDALNEGVGHGETLVVEQVLVVDERVADDVCGYPDHKL